MSGRGVVVGFDGSRSGYAAARWAAGEAQLRAVPLTICQVIGPTGGDSGQAASGRTAPGGDVLGEAIALAQRMAPGITVRGCIRPGHAADVLLQVADDCDLLVVGARAGSPQAGPGLGSVSAHTAARARVPVIVVRGDGNWAGSGIIVGIDDSPTAEAAAGFAFGEAALRRVPLTAVMSCWVPPVPPADSAAQLIAQTRHHHQSHHETYAEEMTRIAENRIKQVLGLWQGVYPDVSVHSALVTGAPHKALCEAASAAGLLVVGSRGLGPVRRTLLGSVSQSVLRHAPCPVAVVPPASD